MHHRVHVQIPQCDFVIVFHFFFSCCNKFSIFVKMLLVVGCCFLHSLHPDALLFSPINLTLTLADTTPELLSFFPLTLLHSFFAESPKGSLLTGSCLPVSKSSPTRFHCPLLLPLWPPWLFFLSSQNTVSEVFCHPSFFFFPWHCSSFFVLS